MSGSRPHSYSLYNDNGGELLDGRAPNSVPPPLAALEMIVCTRREALPDMSGSRRHLDYLYPDDGRDLLNDRAPNSVPSPLVTLDMIVCTRREAILDMSDSRRHSYPHYHDDGCDLLNDRAPNSVPPPLVALEMIVCTRRAAPSDMSCSRRHSDPLYPENGGELLDGGAPNRYLDNATNHSIRNHSIDDGFLAFASLTVRGLLNSGGLESSRFVFNAAHPEERQSGPIFVAEFRSGQIFVNMCNFRENVPTIYGKLTQAPSASEINYSWRRPFSDRRWTFSRRYVMAFLLAVLLVIEETRVWCNNYSLLYAWPETSEKMVNTNLAEDRPRYIILTGVTLRDFRKAVLFGSFLMDFLGGVLCYRFSSHKFLLATVTVSYILHSLIPTALKQQTNTFLLTVCIGQEALAGPIRIAVLSMWKDWAPLDERSRIVTISFLGIAVEAFSTLIDFAVPTGTFESIRYYIGFIGIVWAVLWYNITSSTPQSDPLITEKEYLHITSETPSHSEDKTRLKDVPWMRIFKSKPVAAVCIIFFKLGSSVEAIKNNELLRDFPLDNKIFIASIFFMAFFIFVFIGSSFLLDPLLAADRIEKTKLSSIIIKFFLLVGILLQDAILYGSKYLDYSYSMAIVYNIGYCFFAFNIPGILRNPMDLSLRYVSIIAGLAFGCYHVGQAAFLHDRHMSYSNRDERLSYKIEIECLLSLLTVGMFIWWGDTKEQSWSSLESSKRSDTEKKSWSSLESLQKSGDDNKV